MNIQYPEISGWLVYASNVVLVVTFWSGTWAVVRRVGLARSWPRHATIATGAYLFLAGAMHVELASIAFFQHQYLVGPEGTAPWWVVVTLALKWVSLCFCLWYMIVPDGQKTAEPDAPTPNEPQ